MLMLIMTAVASLLIGSIITQHYYSQILARKSATHRDEIERVKREWHSSGFDGGMAHEKEQQYYRDIKNGIAQL